MTQHFLKIPMLLFHLKVKITHVERYILALVISYGDNLYASNATMSRMLGIARRRIYEAVMSLEKKELILCKRTEGKGRTITLRAGEIIELLKDDLSRAENAPLGRAENAPLKGRQVGRKTHTGRAESAPNSKGIVKGIIITPESFIQHWNSFDSLPAIRAFNDGRKKKLNIRLKEDAFSKNWREIIRKLAGSPFHTGQSKSGWRAGCDWLIENDSNYLKILELPDPLDGVTREADDSEIAALLGEGDE